MRLVNSDNRLSWLPLKLSIQSAMRKIVNRSGTIIDKELYARSYLSSLMFQNVIVGFRIYSIRDDSIEIKIVVLSSGVPETMLIVANSGN